MKKNTHKVTVFYHINIGKIGKSYYYSDTVKLFYLLELFVFLNPDIAVSVNPLNVSYTYYLNNSEYESLLSIIKKDFKKI